MLTGTELGQFRIIEALGKGGMGEVYRAEDTRLGREVALKVLPSDLANDPDRRSRFEREARAVAALNHPNIVTIHSVEEVDGIHFFTMEFVTGQPLSELVPEKGFETRRFCELAADIADALQAAHEQGITHRDIKPANVMINQEGRVKVLDFGLAKLREAASDNDVTAIANSDLTQVGRVMGTVAYMSPEQAEGKTIDSRSDIFSLGVLFYQMATGEKPFQGDTQLSVMSSILKDDPTSVTDLKPGMSARLNQIILKCLRKDPTDRYSSCKQLAHDIRAVARELDTDEVLATRTSIDPYPAQRLRIRWGQLLGHGRTALVVIGLLAVLGVSYLAFQSWDRSPDALQPTSAFADQESVAVFYFQNLTGDPELDWLRTGLTEMLVTDLSQSPNLRVLSTERLYQLLQEMGRQEDRQTSFETVQTIAREARSGSAIVGSFAKVGNQIRIDARLQNTETGEALASERVEGEGEHQLFGMVDELTQKLKRRFQLASLQEHQSDRDLASVTTASVEAYRHYVRGIEQHEVGNDSAAIPYLEKAIELDPDFAMALAKLSVAHGNTENPEKAKEYAKQAVDRVDRLSDRERFYIEGRYYSLDKATQNDAIRAYRQAIEQYPDHSAAEHNLALIYFETGEYELVVEHLENLRRQGMSFPSTHSVLADAYLALDQADKGIEVLREYAGKYPNRAMAHRNLGRHLLHIKDYAAAVRELENGIRLAPRSVDGSLWNALLLSERWDEALQETHRIQALTDDPLHPLGYAFEGVQNLYFGKVESASELLRQAHLRVGPKHPLRGDLESARTSLTLRLGNPERALELAESFLPNANEKQQRDFHLMAAISAAQLGRDDLLARHRLQYDTLIAQSGSHDIAQDTLLEAYLAGLRGDVEASLRQFRIADQDLPKQVMGDSLHSVVWFAIGSLLFQQGKLAEAAPWFEKIQQAGLERLMAPIEYVRSHYFLGAIYESLGLPEKSRSNYSKYLFFWKDGELEHDRISEVAQRLAP